MALESRLRFVVTRRLAELLARGVLATSCVASCGKLWRARGMKLEERVTPDFDLELLLREMNSVKYEYSLKERSERER